MPADVSDLLRLADQLDGAGPKIARTTVECVSKAADVGVAAGKAGAPRESGTLADSIDKTMSGAGGTAGASARVRATAPYAWYVYAGSARGRHTPNPAFLDDARDAAEAELGRTLLPAITKIIS